MPRYLLDTNVISEILKNPHGTAADKLRRHLPHDQVCTSVIVAAELRYGAAKRGSSTLTVRVEEFLQAISVLPFAPDADQHYGNIRVELERKGTIIGGNDLLIAAHALAANCVLVTANQREFARVRGLKSENWVSPLHGKSS